MAGSKETKTEVKHFTTEKTTENAYGYTWNKVVNEYLRSGYKEESNQKDISVLGVTYKVLKRGEVTAFYNADGNTLFDVENNRLEEEYNWLMNNSTGTDLEDGNENVAEEENADMVEKEADSETGEAAEAERAEDEKKKNTDAKAENTKPVKQAAKEKLEKELKSAEDKTFAKAVIGYLLERCEEDEGLAADVIQEHKTWWKCFDYIYGQAKKQSKGNCAAIRDEVVYEWAEDYYHKDDKAEEEKKAKENAERKKKLAKAADDRKSKAKDKKAASTPEKKDDKPIEEAKHKKSSREMEGQLDIFSMMGM